MTGDRKPEQIVRPLRNLVRDGIELVQAEVRHIDLNERRVDTNQVSLPRLSRHRSGLGT